MQGSRGVGRSFIAMGLGFSLLCSVQARNLPTIDALHSESLAKRSSTHQTAMAEVRSISWEDRLGVPAFLSLDPSRAPAAPVQRKSRQDVTDAARTQFKALAGLYGLSIEELDAAPARVHMDLDSGAQIVRFTSERDGIPVFREQATMLLDGQLRALSLGGYLGTTALTGQRKSAIVVPVTPSRAAALALRDFDFPSGIERQLGAVSRAMPSAISGAEKSQQADARPVDGYAYLAPDGFAVGAAGAVLDGPVRYRAIWFRLPDGLVPAWYLEVRVLERQSLHAYAYVIAQDDGRVLFRSSQMAHESVPANGFGAWADPLTGAPYPGPQGLALNPYPHAQPSGYSPELLPASGVMPGPDALWVDASLNAGLRFSSGNNAAVFADTQAPRGYMGAALDSLRSCPTPSQSAKSDVYGCADRSSFTARYDFSRDADSDIGQINASISNAFYVLNWLHDWFYEAGFDEASGNAQRVNFGKGGVEGDPLDVRVVDYTGSNNASMLTPADGASPVMRSYVYRYATPSRSSAMDNTILVHEWGHYLTQRLIGNASGLTTRQAAVLGEGWGDFIAQLVTVTESDRSKPGNERYQGAYAQGAFANASGRYPGQDFSNAAYFGSRRYPYSTDMDKNPLTLKHIQDGVPLPEGPPLNQPLIHMQRQMSQGNAEVHNAGEVWASLLWECYAAILNQRPFDDAQDRMKRYVVAGLKLAPINPTLLESRDAVLAAAAANDPQDYAACLGGFAKRGAGLGAVGPDRLSVSLQGVTESYDAGALLVVDSMALSLSGPDAQRCDEDDILDNGETAVLAVRVLNKGSATISEATLVLQADHAQVSFPAGARLTLHEAIDPGQARTVYVPVSLAGMEGFGHSRIGVTIESKQQEAAVLGRSLDLWLNADIVQNSSTSDAVSVWPGGMDLQGSHWFVAGHEGEQWYQAQMPSDNSLNTWYSPVLKASAYEDVVLTFDHRFAFASDASNGGQLVVSRAYSADWVVPSDMAGYNGEVWWKRNGMVSTNQIRSQPAFVRDSGGWQRNVTVHLGRQYAGQDIRVGWRMGAAAGANAQGTQFWAIDNIRVTGITNQPFASISSNAQSCAPRP